MASPLSLLQLYTFLSSHDRVCACPQTASTSDFAKCAMSFISLPPSSAGTLNCTFTGRLAESSLPLCLSMMPKTVPSMPSKLRPVLCLGA